MALFIDGEINTVQDLVRHESGLLDVSNGEQIDLATKLVLAKESLGTTILGFLLKQTVGEPGSYLYGNQTNLLRRAKGVSDVVVTEPIKRAHAWKTLELVYQDAYYNQLNDRYKQKWLQYEHVSRGAISDLFSFGVGLALNPISRPNRPSLVAVAGDGGGGSYFVQASYVNQAGQESAPSQVAGLVTGNGTVPLAGLSNPPGVATGWNVYVGSTLEGVSLQNDIPLQLGSKWAPPPAGLRIGRSPANGQAPDAFIVERRTVSRG